MLLEIQGMGDVVVRQRERKEIWDEEIQWPIGDIQAAHKIREICRSAADSAGKKQGPCRPPGQQQEKIRDRTLRTRRQSRDGNRPQDLR